jgi:hypothetical protein
MSGLWSGSPASIKLADLDVICAVLGCEVQGLLITEPVQVPVADDQQQKQQTASSAPAMPRSRPSAVTGGSCRLPDGQEARRHSGRRLPGPNCCVVRSLCDVGECGWGRCLRSDRQSEVIEGDAELVPVVLVGSDVVVGAAQVLHEGVTGSEDPR